MSKLWGYVPLVGFLLFVPLSLWTLLDGMFFAWLGCTAFTCWFGYLLFKDTMNLYQGVGPVYWITRDNATEDTPRMSLAIMRQVDAPYRVGKGIQFRWKPYTFQIGIAHIPENANEYTPVMGRQMDEKPTEIGQW